MIEHDSNTPASSFSNAAEMAQLGNSQADHEGDIRYTSPSEQLPEDFPQHKFDLLEGDEVIGGTEIDYFSKPIPLYQLTDLWVNANHAQKGNATKVMERVEAFLSERGKPGVLVDAIMDDNPAQGMYERRGWKPVPQGHGLHTYNWPDNVPIEALNGYVFRYPPLTERSNYADESNDSDT